MTRLESAEVRVLFGADYPSKLNLKSPYMTYSNIIATNCRLAASSQKVKYMSSSPVVCNVQASNDVIFTVSPDDAKAIAI